MDASTLELLKSLPRLLDFPLTLSVVWIGLRVWREAKDLIVRIDDRQHAALRDLAETTERSMDRVTEGMRSIREEIRVLRAEMLVRMDGQGPAPSISAVTSKAGSNGSIPNRRT